MVITTWPVSSTVDAGGLPMFAHSELRTMIAEPNQFEFLAIVAAACCRPPAGLRARLVAGISGWSRRDRGDTLVIVINTRDTTPCVIDIGT
jgi:hypothetical protein